MSTGTKTRRGEKTAFIRQHPNMKASELIAEAKKAGIKLTPTQIYNCRAIDKKKGRRKGNRSKSSIVGNARGNGHGTGDLGSSLVVVAATVKKLGSIENVKQALRLIEQVSGA